MTFKEFKNAIENSLTWPIAQYYCFQYKKDDPDLFWSFKTQDNKCIRLDIESFYGSITKYLWEVDA